MVLDIAAFAHCRAQILEVVASVVGFTPSADQPLMEAGLESLGSVDLRNTLGSRFGIELAPTSTFDYPTVAALAAHIQMLIAPRGIGEGELVASGINWEEEQEMIASRAAVHIVGLSCLYPGAFPFPFLHHSFA